jgi:hypothetical protein
MKQKFEERMSGFEISLINQIDYELAPLTALEKARRMWRIAALIEGRREGAKYEPD